MIKLRKLKNKLRKPTTSLQKRELIAREFLRLQQVSRVLTAIQRTFIGLDHTLSSYYSLNTPFVAAGDFEFNIEFYKSADINPQWKTLAEGTGGRLIVTTDELNQIRWDNNPAEIVSENDVFELDVLNRVTLSRTDGFFTITLNEVNVGTSAIQDFSSVTLTCVGANTGGTADFFSGILSNASFIDKVTSSNNQSYTLSEATGTSEPSAEGVDSIAYNNMPASNRELFKLDGTTWINISDEPQALPSSIEEVFRAPPRTFITLDPILESSYRLNTSFPPTGSFEFEIDYYITTTDGTTSFLASENDADSLWLYKELDSDIVTLRYITSGGLQFFSFSTLQVTLNELSNLKLNYDAGVGFTLTLNGVSEFASITDYMAISGMGYIGTQRFFAWFDGILANAKLTDFVNSANNQSYTLGNATGNTESSLEGGDTITYVNIPESNRESFAFDGVSAWLTTPDTRPFYTFDDVNDHVIAAIPVVASDSLWITIVYSPPRESGQDRYIIRDNVGANILYMQVGNGMRWNKCDCYIDGVLQSFYPSLVEGRTYTLELRATTSFTVETFGGSAVGRTYNNRISDVILNDGVVHNYPINDKFTNDPVIRNIGTGANATSVNFDSENWNAIEVV